MDLKGIILNAPSVQITAELVKNGGAYLWTHFKNYCELMI